MIPPPPLVVLLGRQVLIDKVRKFRAKEFQGRSKDDLAKVEYWLENIQWVFSEMACSLDDYLRCVISLLKEEAYSWWSTINAIVLEHDIY